MKFFWQLSHKQLLSDAAKSAIYTVWKKLLDENSNLRLWQSHTIRSMPDDTFDSDIMSFLQDKATSDIRLSIQLVLRRKYHIGLNEKYIDWRLKYISKQVN